MNRETTADVVYPECDGEPIGETDLHIHWTLRVRDILKWRYRDQRVYVAADLLLYYFEGVPSRYVVPDVFVVKNSDPGMRRVYKLWEEGQPPHFVLEITSSSTRQEDEARKPQKYAAMGVREYFLYDPTGDYLRPRLQGHRLVGAEYVRIEADAQARLLATELDMHLGVEQGNLALWDASTGATLMTAAEAREQQAITAEHKAETAQNKADAAQLKADTAEQLAAAAEQEVQRLRELLKRHGIED
jgi:Uma2 family endonuclease